MQISYVLCSIETRCTPAGGKGDFVRSTAATQEMRYDMWKFSLSLARVYVFAFLIVLIRWQEKPYKKHEKGGIHFRKGSGGVLLQLGGRGRRKKKEANLS